jgi:hypothetical protein
MWRDGQNLDKPLAGPDGTRWFFRVWHGTVGGVHCQDLFVWNAARAESIPADVLSDLARHAASPLTAAQGSRTMNP